MGLAGKPLHLNLHCHRRTPSIVGICWKLSKSFCNWKVSNSGGVGQKVNPLGSRVTSVGESWMSEMVTTVLGSVHEVGVGLGGGGVPGLLLIFTFSVSILRACLEEVIDFFLLPFSEFRSLTTCQTRNPCLGFRKVVLFGVVSFPASRFLWLRHLPLSGGIP